MLSDRDYNVIKTIGRFRFMLGRHIQVLCDFPSTRTTDRRLKTLMENGYIERNKVLYGIPSLYQLTHKGRILVGLNKRADKIRIERIQHDIHVLDCVVYFLRKENIQLQDISTEKELHSKNGFGIRNHFPDFIFIKDNKTHAIEIELSLKAKDRLEKNIQTNFLTYDTQIWIVPKYQNKIIEIIESNMHKFSNIIIIYLEVINE